MCVSSVLVSNSLPRCFPKVAKKSCNQQWCRQGGHTVHGHIWEITSIAGAGRLVAAEVWANQKLNQDSKPAKQLLEYAIPAATAARHKNSDFQMGGQSQPER